MALINSRTIKILVGVAILGFIVSFPPLLSYLGMQAPWVAFVVWYGLFFAFVSWVGVSILPGRFRLRHAIGFVVLYFGIAPVLGYVDNPFLSQDITGAKITGVESGPEETILTYFWFIFTSNPTALLYLVYVISPVILTLFALWILKPQVFTKFFERMVLT